MKVCKHRPVYFLFSVPQTHQTPSRHLCAPHSLQTHNTSQLQSRTSPVLLNINISHVRLIISHKFIRFSNISQLNNFGAILLLLLFPSFPRCGCRMIFITRKWFLFPALQFHLPLFQLFLGTHKTFQRRHLSYRLVLYRCPVDIIIICVL